MKIDRDEARRIAGLAHLEFDDSALERMAADMTRVLEYMEVLESVDVDDGRSGQTPGQAGLPALHATPLREDVVRPSISREGVERNAPDFENGFFVVPAIIENEP
ncbi:MAG: Asp-tRNA(Asn)/Glu-tRNA(Gln) amidotransferase subunit GatC [Thermoanaerobaculia bacterium]